MQLVCQYEVRLQRYIAMIDMRVLFDKTKRKHMIDASLKQSYAFYAAFDGIPGLQASGAYIFSIQMVNILLALRSRFVTIELSGILK
uniref:Uncharacterized protein n=1 Tax=Helianthus annuus TaxID=4232 RepID=A0A251U727_HELAN